MLDSTTLVENHSLVSTPSPKHCLAITLLCHTLLSLLSLSCVSSTDFERHYNTRGFIGGWRRDPPLAFFWVDGCYVRKCVPRDTDSGENLARNKVREWWLLHYDNKSI